MVANHRELLSDAVTAVCRAVYRWADTVADPEFHNGGGGRSRGRGLRRGLCPLPRKKFEFLPENGGFWCILGLLFKIGQANGGAAAPSAPLDPPLG